MLASTSTSDELPSINMTPMVDVVLCLLIFFLAATRLYDWDQNEFQVSVPEVESAGPLTAAPDDLNVVVTAPGKVLLDDRSLGLTELTAVLKEAQSRYREQGVLVRGDAKITYQDLADVLSACNSAGIKNVRLPVKPREAAK